MIRTLVAVLAILALLPDFSAADIYRWEDDAGTIHFSDDLTNIPPAYRGKAQTVIREAPGSGAEPRERERRRQPESVSPPAIPGEGILPAREESEKERLASEIEQLRAKITAKENHIRTIDDRRSLAVNPFRNRIVEAADMELYNKYKTELPADREQLQELETLAESVR
jgi:hypothetical protein